MARRTRVQQINTCRSVLAVWRPVYVRVVWPCPWGLQAKFTGYTNGDIAFDSSLIDVLRGVERAIEKVRSMRAYCYHARTHARYSKLLARSHGR